MITRLVLAFTLVGVFAAPAAFSAPEPLTSCGQIVTEGVLTGDLDCSEAEGFAVTIADGGSLDLAGFTLTGTRTSSLDYQTALDGGGVRCAAVCTITGGGGAIVAPAGLADRAYNSFGIHSDRDNPKSFVTASDIAISGWRQIGVDARHVVISNCTINDNWIGVHGYRTLVMDNCTAAGNAEAAHLRVGTISNSSITGSEWSAVYTLRKLKMVNSVVTGNQKSGLDEGKVRLENSTVSGNCLDTSTVVCADLYVRRHPYLLNSSCETSRRQLDVSRDWNVCEFD